MNGKKIIVGVLAIVLLAIGYNISQPEDVVTKPVGAVSGPDISSPYLSVNGVATYYNRIAPVAATTTVCAIKSPVATSTLTASSVFLRVSSTTASTVTIAKATTPYATTTWLTNESVAAGAQATITIPATTTTTGIAKFVFAPSTYLVVGMQGGVGTFSPTGVCTADFRIVE